MSQKHTPEELVSVKRSDLESIERKGHNQVCPACRNTKYNGHKITCWLNNALIGRGAMEREFNPQVPKAETGE